MEKGQRCLAVVRVRGSIDVRTDIKETLKMLNLTHNCQATLIDDRASYLGMLQKAQNRITWGEPSKETIALLLKERGRAVGDQKLTDEYAKKAGYGSLDQLAEAIHNLKVQFKCLPGIKPVFRLHPPKKGFKGTVKKSYKSGGATGYRGEAINQLIKRMT
ncbi:MAG: 50S ribosomal protein L30 [Candidatus Bathyarchaeota archaeon]|nr:50S ribosomal protein L30 [Candidatus Bathyarchaeota archaeon]